MIRIAICDDIQVMRTEVRKQLSDYGSRHSLEYCIYEYSNGTELLMDDKEYDLVFLDYEFKNDEKNDGSSFPHIVFDSFSVGTFRFLVKPIKADKFTKAMDDFLETLKKDSILTIKVEGVNRNLHTDEIIYVEGAGKYCIIHLAGSKEKKIECHETLAAIESRIPKENFFRCHRSYLVAFSYIESYNHVSIVLSSGEEIIMLAAARQDAT